MSCLDDADFIQAYGADVEENLHELWRRIVFNIAISNTGDHLRNHGFILSPPQMDAIINEVQESIKHWQQ